MNNDKLLEKIIIVDYGSQFTQLIARKVRECGVYSEIINFNREPEITFLSGNNSFTSSKILSTPRPLNTKSQIFSFWHFLLRDDLNPQ